MWPFFISKPDKAFRIHRFLDKKFGVILAKLICMKTHQICLILISCFSLFISKVSSAGTEGEVCQECYLNQQASTQFVTATGELGGIAKVLSGWVNIKTPKTAVATQLEAGYPNGCGITAMLYTLKLGPAEYRNSYEKIPGNTDIEKIRSLVSKFSAMGSKDNPKQPAFSEQYGTNPNDVPWMFQSLVADSNPLKETTFLNPISNRKIDSKMLQDFQKKSTLSLIEGKPIIVQLQYTNPSAAHAVIITGIERQASSNGKIKIQILDPLTGKESVATIAPGIGKFGDTDFSMLTFSNPAIASRSGFLFSIAF